jgi:hypothetical protein
MITNLKNYTSTLILKNINVKGKTRERLFLLTQLAGINAG